MAISIEILPKIDASGMVAKVRLHIVAGLLENARDLLRDDDGQVTGLVDEALDEIKATLKDSE